MPHEGHLREHLAEVIDRQDLGDPDALAPVADEGPQRNARHRHDHGQEQPEDQDCRGDPAPLAERQRPLATGLALHGDVLAGVLQQVALQHHERERDRDDADRDRGHQVAGRRASLLVSLYR
jgi:hypothetical protein